MSGILSDQDTVTFQTDFEPIIDMDSIADIIVKSRDAHYTCTQRRDSFRRGLNSISELIVKEAASQLHMADTMVIAGLRELEKEEDSLSRVYF